jgi:hypothetical protein
MERCALSNGDWIRAAANAIAFSRTGHAAAAPKKHQSRCNVWMGGHGEFKCGPRGRFALAHNYPLCASIIDRQIDSPSPKPPGFVV